MILTGPVGRYQNYLSILKKCEQSFFQRQRKFWFVLKKETFLQSQLFKANHGISLFFIFIGRLRSIWLEGRYFCNDYTQVFLMNLVFFISLINKFCEAEYYVTNKRKSQKPKPGLHLHVLGPSSQVPPSELQFEQAPTYFVHFPLGPQPGTHSHSYGLLEQCPFSQGTPHPLMVSQWLPSIHKRQITKSNQKSKKRGGWKRKKKRI